MKADEIRKKFQSLEIVACKQPPNEAELLVLAVLAEIAAQLAEFNERMASWDTRSTNGGGLSVITN